MPSQRLLTIALGALSIPALSFVAYVAAHSVSDNPDPQVILPVNTRAPAPHPGTDRLAGRTDHPADIGISAFGSPDSGRGDARHAS